MATALQKIILEKSKEGFSPEEIANHLTKMGIKKRTNENYDAKTIINYQSELRKVGFTIPHKYKKTKNINIAEENKSSDECLIPTISAEEVFPNFNMDLIDNDEEAFSKIEDNIIKSIQNIDSDKNFSVTFIKVKGIKNLKAVLDL